mgnify:CR=1 FL=1
MLFRSQVFGGYGYVHEMGIEQTLRDARIAMIYEGTNEIQAIDLLQRKILADGGAALAIWMAEARSEAQACASLGLTGVSTALLDEIERADTALISVRERAPEDPELALRVADDVLFGLSHTFMAWAHAVSIRTAKSSKVLTPQAAKSKIDTHDYGLQWVLPQSGVHWTRVSNRALHLPTLTPLG